MYLILHVKYLLTLIINKKYNFRLFIQNFRLNYQFINYIHLLINY